MPAAVPASSAQIALSGFRLHFDHRHHCDEFKKPTPPTEFQNPDTEPTLFKYTLLHIEFQDTSEIDM